MDLLRCTGYELLKGLAGVTTHEHEERVPIIANTQEYAVAGGEVEGSVTRESARRMGFC